MLDVLIVGAGPAGAVAGLVLARAGARVRLVDRAAFPRDKLCGDTVNPGTLARLRRLGVASDIEARGLPVAGMRVTGDHGVVVEGRYPEGLTGRAMVRRDLDSNLLERAIAAGCEFMPVVAARAAVVDQVRSVSMVTGVRLGSGRTAHELRARVIIAADGRRSTLAFGLGLARHPNRPRRWAIGAYVETPSPLRPGSVPTPSPLRPTCVPVFGEMHIRRGGYTGVAPLSGGITNICVVKPSGPADRDLYDAAAFLFRELAADPMLRDRFADARLVAPPVVLGPLAVDVSPEQLDGLLLAGDAAGFLDPMTGDGLRFAVEGGELAAAAALDALQDGWRGVHARLAARRRRAFATKHSFNRVLRGLVASPRAVGAATLAARLAPAALRATIRCAGDCDVAVRIGVRPTSESHHRGLGGNEENAVDVH
jgi:flavin-dependent dehydrogenase